VHADVRIVCATNRELQQMVQQGQFREDLYFRINTFEIYLPPLRERLDDIPALALHLIARHLKRDTVPASMVPPETIRALQAHTWPGNIRELANVLEHALILSDGEVLKPSDLPRTLRRASTEDADRAVASPIAGTVAPAPAVTSPLRTLRQMEEDMIWQALERHKGDKPAAARDLGIALKTLYNKLSQLGEQRNAG